MNIEAAKEAFKPVLNKLQATEKVANGFGRFSDDRANLMQPAIEEFRLSLSNIIGELDEGSRFDFISDLKIGHTIYSTHIDAAYKSATGKAAIAYSDQAWMRNK